MTNELEKQFFQCFGIESKKEYYCPSCDTKLEEWKTEKGLYYMCGNCCECDYVLDSLDEEFEEILKNLSYRTEYPQITNHILLELICILTEWRQYCASDYIIKAINIDILKNDILKDCLYMSNWYEFKKCGKDIKHQVRTLFGE